MFRQLTLPLLILLAAAVWLLGCGSSEPATPSASGPEFETSTRAELPAPTHGPFRDLTLDQALEWGSKTERPVVVDVFATWCGPCKLLDRTTWRDPEVVRWLTEAAIALKIDGDRQPELVERYRIDAYPTVLVLDGEGDVRRRLKGVQPIQAWARKRPAGG